MELLFYVIMSVLFLQCTLLRNVVETVSFLANINVILL